MQVQAERQDLPSSIDSKAARETYCEYKLEMVSSYLPAPISEYIIERFCDDMDVDTYKQIDFESPCKVCMARQKQLLKRRHMEKQLVHRNESRDSPAYFLVSSQWLLMQWKVNICLDTEDDKFMKQYFYDSFEMPTVIDNSSLFDESGEELRENLQEQVDFYFVNCYVFEIFERLYGVNQAIGRAKKSLDSPAVDYSQGNVSAIDLAISGRLDRNRKATKLSGGGLRGPRREHTRHAR